MRDIDRIEPFVRKLAEVWKLAPEWRFGQLVENARSMQSGVDAWNAEDTKWLTLLNLLEKALTGQNKTNS